MEPIIVSLDEETRSRLDRPVEGQGGFQDLLRLLQDCLSEEKPGQIRIESRESAEKIVRYVEKYGQGGFQKRLQEIANQIQEKL